MNATIPPYEGGYTKILEDPMFEYVEQICWRVSAIITSESKLPPFEITNRLRSRYPNTSEVLPEQIQKDLQISSVEAAKQLTLMLGDVVNVGTYTSVWPDSYKDTIIRPMFGVFTVVTTLMLMIRLWARWKIGGKIRSFDWVMMAAWALTIAWGTVAVIRKKDDWIYHAWMVRTNNHRYQLHIAFRLRHTFIGLLARYLPFRIAVYIIFGVSLLSTVAGIVAAIKTFNNVIYWSSIIDGLINLSDLQRMIKVALAVGGLNIGTDIAVWLVPCALLLKLTMISKWMKWGAFFMLGVGVMLRAVYVFTTLGGCYQYAHDISKWTMYLSPMYPNNMILMIYRVELNIALICASIPSLRALISNHRRSSRSKESTSSNSHMHTGRGSISNKIDDAKEQPCAGSIIVAPGDEKETTRLDEDDKTRTSTIDV